MTPREVLEYANKNKAQVVDLKFVDLPGTWQHFTIPMKNSTKVPSRMAPAWTARPSAAGRRSITATCWSCRIRLQRVWTPSRLCRR